MTLVSYLRLKISCECEFLTIMFIQLSAATLEKSTTELLCEEIFKNIYIYIYFYSIETLRAYIYIYICTYFTLYRMPTNALSV